MFMSRSYGKPFVTKLIEASVRLKGHILKVKRSHPKGICRWAWPDPPKKGGLHAPCMMSHRKVKRSHRKVKRSHPVRPLAQTSSLGTRPYSLT